MGQHQITRSFIYLRSITSNAEQNYVLPLIQIKCVDVTVLFNNSICSPETKVAVLLSSFSIILFIPYPKENSHSVYPSHFTFHLPPQPWASVRENSSDSFFIERRLEKRMADHARKEMLRTLRAFSNLPSLFYFLSYLWASCSSSCLSLIESDGPISHITSSYVCLFRNLCGIKKKPIKLNPWSIRHGSVISATAQGYLRLGLNANPKEFAVLCQGVMKFYSKLDPFVQVWIYYPDLMQARIFTFKSVIADEEISAPVLKETCRLKVKMWCLNCRLFLGGRFTPLSV